MRICEITFTDGSRREFGVDDGFEPKESHLDPELFVFSKANDDGQVLVRMTQVRSINVYDEFQPKAKRQEVDSRAENVEGHGRSRVEWLMATSEWRACCACGWKSEGSHKRVQDAAEILMAHLEEKA